MSEVQSKLFPYKNKNLFSRHYLTDRLERTSIWDVDDEELENAYDELKQLYDDKKELLPHRGDDEEEVRNELITPILRQVLGFRKEQEKKSGNSQRVPDYALYDTKQKKTKAVKTGEYYEAAIGILEAKAWKKDLEKKTATGHPSTDDSNPTKQIVDYLIENKPQWGILTNGKKWRLVNREASNRLDTYYEVDIENLLTSDRPREERLEEFKYFYVFFRKQAFQGDEGDKLLDELLEESLQYAEDIGEDLEENIYQALEWLAKGFIQNNSNDGIEDVPIEEIHDNSLIYLYRLLFALYADSRGILGNPSEEYEYHDFSALVDEVSENLDRGKTYGTTGKLSNRLNAIFRMIDQGSRSRGIPTDELDIPAYNGGLFSQDRHEFLKEYNLYDKYLAKVIDLVARTEGEEGGRAQVDYYDLSVRHLGGIYEGLLEYQLEKADEDMVEVKEDGDKVVKTVEQAEEDGDSLSDDEIIEEGQPYLVTDDGERKATGSYYTPDYIVKYIVENTVGPKVEEEIEGLDSEEERAEAILDMQILDPAMGSAHFLVEVIDYLATELVDHKEIEIEQAKREVARQCVYGVDVNPLATELGQLSIWLKTISEDKPLSFLDHHIKTGNSLIGADIHDINRHPEEDEDSKRQVTIGEEFGEENAGVVRANVQEMLKKFKEIQEKQADSPEDIKEQEELYQEFLDFPFRKRFDVLADVYTSHYFDNDYKVDDYNRLLQAFKLSEQKEEGDEEWNKVIKEDWVQKATDSLKNSHEENNMSNQKGFFHWKLEFPEVFFDIEEGVEQEDAGFDAVVGNPPYARIQSLKKNFPQAAKYYEEMYQSSTQNFDIYANFTEKSWDLLEKDGLLGYIEPHKFFQARMGEGLRELISENNALHQITHFGEHQVFPAASVYTCLLFLSKTPKDEFKFAEAEPVEIEESRNIEHYDLEAEYRKDKWVFNNPKTQNILDKIDAAGKSLDELTRKIFVGLQTSADKIYLLEKIEEPENGTVKVRDQVNGEEWELETGMLKPILKGDDVHRYQPLKPNYWVIFPYELTDDGAEFIEPETVQSEYPETWKYLKSKEEDLRGREGGKMDHEKWYEFGRLNNLDEFEESKILTPEMSDGSNFAYDSEGLYHNTMVYSFILKDEVEIDDKYLLSVLNNDLLWFFLSNTGGGNVMRGGYFRFKTDYLNPFSVPDIEFKLDEEERDERVSDLKQDFLDDDLDLDALEMKPGVKHDFLGFLADQMTDLNDDLEAINLNIRDYLTTSLDDPDGKTLGEMYMPVEGLSDSILTDTKKDRDNIKIGSVEFEEQNNSLILSVSVRYKPEDDEEFDDEELDRWGYYETDLMPAMKFTVGDKMKALIKEFVPVAVDEAGGFANFREKATKTNSVVDRLEDLILPKLDDVEQGLEKFIENKEEAEALEEEIQETDELIDAIVFDLYDLTEEEVETVLDSLDTPEGEKASIMEKFEQVSSGNPISSPQL